MKKHSMLVNIGLFSVFFAVIHKTALSLSLYWTVGWFDSFMHAFGGIIGSLLVIFVLLKIGISAQTCTQKIILLVFVFISVLAVGSIWELWEIFIGFTDPFTDLADTISDLVMDSVGAIIGFIYYDKKLRTKN